MSAVGSRHRTQLAQKYAALAQESELRGEHGRAADFYRAALLILYNTPIPEFRRERGVPDNDTETRMPTDRPVAELDLSRQTGAEGTVLPELTPQGN